MSLRGSVASGSAHENSDVPDNMVKRGYAAILAAQNEWAPDKPFPLAYNESWSRGIEPPKPAFLVLGRITFGIWSHSAPPGGYKSAFASQFEHCIAWGTPLPGLDWKMTERGDCLVITPDESMHEVRDRSLRVTPGGTLDHDGMAAGSAPHDIHVRHVPQGGDLSLRIQWMWFEIERIEQATGRKIVWIRWDTLGSLLGDRGGVDHYTHSMPLQKLNADLANSRRVLFLPNHIGKDGKAIGTVGIGAHSNLWTETEITKVAETGNLIVHKMRNGSLWKAGLTMTNGLLELCDLSPQQAAHDIGTLPRRVVDYLHKVGPSSIAAIREGTAIAESSLWNVMLRLKTKREVYNDRGTWQLVDHGATSEAPTAVDAPAAAPPAVPKMIWKYCPACRKVEDLIYGCNNLGCSEYRDTRPTWVPPILPKLPTAEPAVEQVSTPTDTPDNSPALELTPKPSRPEWRARSSRAKKVVECPPIDASFRMELDGKGNPKRVWEHSPIGRAIDLIMQDRDEGRLTPRWRVDQPPEIKHALDGNHHFGVVPRRYLGEYLERPAGPAVSMDTYGSFLSSYKTPLAIKPLVRYEGEWTAKASGAVELLTPEWPRTDIGHPLGSDAKPGTWQVFWNPSVRLLQRLADMDEIEFPKIRQMFLRPMTYQNASENLLAAFQAEMKVARETYREGPESDYIKAMYSAWLSSAANGTSNVFKRRDWTGSIRSEAFNRGWWHGFTAVQAGAEILAMGNTDEIVFRPHAALETLFPQDKILWGKLKIKDQWEE
jgi:hypothetical protein